MIMNIINNMSIVKKNKSLEQIYNEITTINNELKPPVIKNLGSDEFENSGKDNIFIGNYTNKGLHYSDSYVKSMKRGINKNWWRDLVNKT